MSFENAEKEIAPQHSSIQDGIKAALGDEAFAPRNIAGSSPKPKVDGELMSTGDVLIHQDKIIMPSGQELLVGNGDWTLRHADGKKVVSSEDFPEDGKRHNLILPDSHIGVLADGGHWTIAYPKGDIVDIERNDSARESGMNVSIKRDDKTAETSVVNLKEVSKSSDSQWNQGMLPQLEFVGNNFRGAGEPYPYPQQTDYTPPQQSDAYKYQDGNIYK